MTRHVLKAAVNKYYHRNNSYKPDAAQLKLMIILTGVQEVQKLTLLLSIFSQVKNLSKIYIFSVSAFRIISLSQYQSIDAFLHTIKFWVSFKYSSSIFNTAVW